QDRADFQVAWLVETELADVFLRLAVRLIQNLLARLLLGLASFRFEIGRDMAALGAGRLLAVFVFETELNGVVTVALLGPNLQNGARPYVDDRDGMEHALVVIDLGHAHLKTDKSKGHRNLDIGR